MSLFGRWLRFYSNSKNQKPEKWHLKNIWKTFEKHLKNRVDTAYHNEVDHSSIHQQYSTRDQEQTFGFAKICPEINKQYKMFTRKSTLRWRKFKHPHKTHTHTHTHTHARARTHKHINAHTQVRKYARTMVHRCTRTHKHAHKLLSKIAVLFRHNKAFWGKKITEFSSPIWH